MNDPLHNLPPGITEEDLIALVEGDLGETRAHALRTTLASRPDLLRLVDGMRADRTALTTLERAPAPAGLVAAAESTLRGELLAGGIVEPEVTTLRVSSVQPHRRPGVIATIADLLTSSTLARGLAVAAGFSLAAGVLLWGVVAIVAEISQPVRIAGNDDAPPALEHSTPTPPDETRLATREEEQLDASGPADPTGAALAANDATPSGDPLEQLDAFPLAQAMDGEHALALARQGRLAVRVRVGSPDIALARVENLRRQSQREGVIWRALPADISGPMYLAMTDSLSRPVINPPMDPSRPTAVAGDPADAPRPREGEPQAPRLPQPTGVLAAAYDLQLPASATTLESLRRALTRDRFQIAEFVELPDPVQTEPVLDPRTMFWWDQAPAAWDKKIRVPVLIESVQ